MIFDHSIENLMSLHWENNTHAMLESIRVDMFCFICKYECYLTLLRKFLTLLGHSNCYGIRTRLPTDAIFSPGRCVMRYFRRCFQDIFIGGPKIEGLEYRQSLEICKRLHRLCYHQMTLSSTGHILDC